MQMRKTGVALAALIFIGAGRTSGRSRGLLQGQAGQRDRRLWYRGRLRRVWPSARATSGAAYSRHAQCRGTEYARRGSLRAVNYIYNTAPKDGTALAIFARDMPLLGIIGGNANVRFDARKLTWLGSSSSYANDAYFLFVRKDAQVKSIEDARRAGGPPIVLGGTAEGATGNDIATVVRDALGLNIKLIAGYPDSNALFLAVDRKELDGRFVGLSATSSSHPEWLTPNGGMQKLLQFARVTRHPEFPDVPTARELALSDKSLALVALGRIALSAVEAFRRSAVLARGSSKSLAEGLPRGPPGSPISRGSREIEGRRQPDRESRGGARRSRISQRHRPNFSNT